MCVQEFDMEEFLECMKDLVRIDKDWVPKLDGCSLYIRPTFIGTEVCVVNTILSFGCTYSVARK